MNALLMLAMTITTIAGSVVAKAQTPVADAQVPFRFELAQADGPRGQGVEEYVYNSLHWRITNLRVRNLALYPKVQHYFRTRRPPLLAVWGRNDPYFVREGAEAFKRDITDAQVELLDMGHFALETHSAEIAVIVEFLQHKLDASGRPDG
jgi:pimeloyl-ACP methyl ester carboxylesterase